MPLPLQIVLEGHEKQMLSFPLYLGDTVPLAETHEKLEEEQDHPVGKRVSYFLEDAVKCTHLIGL